MSGWTTCRFCPERINGQYKAEKHEKAAHPLEVKYKDAKDRLARVDTALGELDMDSYRLDALKLAMGRECVPPLIMPYLTRPYDDLLREYTQESDAWQQALTTARAAWNAALDAAWDAAWAVAWAARAAWNAALDAAWDAERQWQIDHFLAVMSGEYIYAPPQEAANER